MKTAVFNYYWKIINFIQYFVTNNEKSNKDESVGPPHILERRAFINIWK